MRDMSIGSAGAAARSQYVATMGTVAANSWDPNKLIKAAMDARSLEKRTAMAADAKVRSTEIQAERLLKEVKIDQERFDAKMSAKGTMRKAGLIAAAGGLAGMALTKPTLPEKPDWSPEIEFNKRYAERTKVMQQELEELRRRGPDQISDYLPQESGTETSFKAKPASEMNVQELARAKPPSKASSLVGGMGFSNAQWNTYRETLAEIESGGRYDIPGGSNMAYDGRYQMGAAAKTDGARFAGIADPGHSPAARQAFRNNPQLQEQLFAGYTKANHTYLMRHPKYSNASPERRLEILGYAHNQGMGNAEKYLNTGVTGYDGFNTPGELYPTRIREAFSQGLYN